MGRDSSGRGWEAFGEKEIRERLKPRHKDGVQKEQLVNRTALRGKRSRIEGGEHRRNLDGYDPSAVRAGEGEEDFVLHRPHRSRVPEVLLLTLGADEGYRADDPHDCLGGLKGGRVAFVICRIAEPRTSCRHF